MLVITETEWSTLLPSQQEMAALDARTIESGVDSQELMERAGRVIFSELLTRFSKGKKELLILCGPGNNGGDGLVLARLCKRKRIKQTVVIAASARYSPDFERQLEKYCKSGGKPLWVGTDNPKKSIELSKLSELLRPTTIVVDAMLGTGQKSAPRGAVETLVKWLEGRACRSVLSVDIPTGVNADTGELFEAHVEADVTVSLELIKRGMLQYPGRSACGEICARSIGISGEAGSEFKLLVAKELELPTQRSAAAHKGNFGHVFVIAGSLNMPGAGELAATAALRSGAGLVTRTALKAGLHFGGTPELMLEVVDERNRGCLSTDDLPALLERAKNSDVVVLGPGLGQSAVGIVEELVRLIQCPLVLDADGLNLIANSVNSGKFSGKLSHVVMTPHPGEMARLLNLGVAEIQADRYAAVRALHQKTGATVVLKGASSVVYSLEGGAVNLTGNPYMATAGSGDVLSGVIAALMAQGLGTFEAACSGVFLHGLAGDIARLRSASFIIASDIIAELPGAFAQAEEWRSDPKRGSLPARLGVPKRLQRSA